MHGLLEQRFSEGHQVGLEMRTQDHFEQAAVDLVVEIGGEIRKCSSEERLAQITVGRIDKPDRAQELLHVCIVGVGLVQKLLDKNRLAVQPDKWAFHGE